MKNIGIDIGGTFIKAAIVEKGKIIISSKTPTPKDGGALIDAIVDIMKCLLDKASLGMSDIENIGIGAPGACDSRNGRIINCPNIPHCKNIDICAGIEKATGIRTLLDNDANCAALGEYMTAEYKANGFIFVTLGTGVGGGIIIDGKILRGVNALAGEVGHMVLRRNGEQCNCGRRGCWERYASVSALVRQAKSAGMTGEVSGKSLFSYMKKGNMKAKDVIDSWLVNVSEGICNLVNIFQPDMVVIGGGISREGDLILNSVKEFVRKNAFSAYGATRECEIRISSLFNDAGVVGAAFLYTQN